jgi:hypothetical protein
VEKWSPLKELEQAGIEVGHGGKNIAESWKRERI